MFESIQINCLTLKSYWYNEGQNKISCYEFSKGSIHSTVVSENVFNVKALQELLVN